ncbi:hypothetical protein [Shewanella halifaxensis]|uniref:hypothetical protein n=1 Tax=Shewanella halifaxensis TaxID=271098 RepID=UPI000D59988A|nr:hypothetical protein [Shewanella halifaxensis]
MKLILLVLSAAYFVFITLTGNIEITGINGALIVASTLIMAESIISKVTNSIKAKMSMLMGISLSFLLSNDISMVMVLLSATVTISLLIYWDKKTSIG